MWDNGTLSTQLDLSNLNAGIYFINLSNGGNDNITQRIVIAK